MENKDLDILNKILKELQELNQQLTDIKQWLYYKIINDNIKRRD